jgi:SWI/SNF related-matrix-associated actin-dependent regulator of chromatin subfamily C
VAAHVGSRSQLACIAHFVRLPIEDLCVDDVERWSEQQQQGQGQRPQQQQGQQQTAPQPQLPPLPFQDALNPLSSTLGVLAITMGPKVAAAAASRALQVLAENDADAGATDLAVGQRVAAAAARAAAARRQAAAGTAAAANGNGAAAGDGMDVDGADAGEQEQQEQQQLEAALAASADPKRPIERPVLLAATAACLAAAATRARQLAGHEEREIQRVMLSVTTFAMKRVDARVNMLTQLMEPAVRLRWCVWTCATQVGA